MYKIIFGKGSLDNVYITIIMYLYMHINTYNCVYQTMSSLFDRQNNKASRIIRLCSFALPAIIDPDHELNAIPSHKARG